MLPLLPPPPLRFEFSVCYPELAVLLLQIKRGKSSGSDSGRSGGSKSAYAAVPIATMREGVYKIVMRKGATGEIRPNKWIKVRTEHRFQGGCIARV